MVKLEKTSPKAQKSTLEVRSISHSYSSKRLLKSISFSIKSGEIVVLMGESGSGKTTMLNILAGLLPPKKGQVFVNGEAIYGTTNRLIPGHAKIGYAKQHIELMPMLSAAENIGQAILHLMPREKNRKITTLINALSLQDCGKKPLRQLSGGQQQRVALAKQLAADRDFFLFDEIFSQLDNATKSNILLSLKQYLKENGKGAIFVLHSPNDAFFVADEIMVLENGRLIQRDTPIEVFHRPASVKTAALFGLINVLPKELVLKHVPNAHFHTIGNDFVFRPNNLKLSNLPKSAKIIDRVELPEYTLLIVALAGYNWLVSG